MDHQFARFRGCKMAVSLTCRLARLVAALLIVEACASGDRPTAPRSRPEFAISDAVHEGGTPGFYFLPPMVALPTFSGTFDADITTLNPAIAICDITSSPDANCGSSGGTPAVRVFTTATTPAITLDPTTPQYQVKWDTREAGFVADHTYRLHVTAGASGARRELGFADVLLTTTPGQAKDVAPDLIVLKDGRPLPIHFRIETGIVGSVSVSAASPSVQTGGTDLLTATVQDLHGAPLVGATVAWSVTAAPGVVATLEPTSGPTTLLTAGTTPGTAVVAATSAGISATATVTVLAAGKPLYVANEVFGSSITVYAPGASGNATPTATIAGDNTGLSFPFGVALDGAGNIYVTNSASSVGGSNSITVYAAGASGNATPAATIAGGNTGLDFPTGIALDGTGNIYVGNSGGNITVDGSITVYAAGASGSATPTATIASGNTVLSIQQGIALDGAGNIYVANIVSNSITIYAAGTNGNATPAASIAGGNTGLSLPVGIALEGAGNLYVTNFSGTSVTAYGTGGRGEST